jgi:hypothetical protein
MRFYDLARGRHLCMLEFDEIRSSVFMIGSKICPLTSVCMPRRSVGSIGPSRILTPSSDRRDNKYVRGSVLPMQRRISTDRVASPYAECSPTVETMRSKGRAGGACCRYDKAITDYDAALTEGVLTWRSSTAVMPISPPVAPPRLRLISQKLVTEWGRSSPATTLTT